MMLSGTDAVRVVSSDFRGICLHTADVDSGPLAVQEGEMWQAEGKVSAKTPPIRQQKCLSETMPGTLETLPLAPPVPVIAHTTAQTPSGSLRGRSPQKQACLQNSCFWYSLQPF